MEKEIHFRLKWEEEDRNLDIPISKKKNLKNFFIVDVYLHTLECIIRKLKILSWW
jgi:hypothetical protein